MSDLYCQMQKSIQQIKGVQHIDHLFPQQFQKCSGDQSIAC